MPLNTNYEWNSISLSALLGALPHFHSQCVAECLFGWLFSLLRASPGSLFVSLVMRFYLNNNLRFHVHMSDLLFMCPQRWNHRWLQIITLNFVWLNKYCNIMYCTGEAALHRINGGHTARTFLIFYFPISNAGSFFHSTTCTARTHNKRQNGFPVLSILGQN